jgi:hypothetical protein
MPASGTTPITGAVPAWNPDVNYFVANQVNYKDKVYECLQSHRSQVGWEPPNVPALWRIPPPQGPGISVWQNQTFYHVGTKVIFKGENYECIQEHTSQNDWTPPVTPALWKNVVIIRRVRCPTEVVQGESFDVIVLISDQYPDAVVAINGALGSSHTFQFWDYIGVHIISVTVSVKGSVTEVRRLEVKVKVPADAHHKYPFIVITEKKSTSAGFAIQNVSDHLPGTTYFWNFGPAGSVTTDGTVPTIRSFEEHLDPEQPFTTFDIKVKASFPDKTSLTASQTLVVHNRYFLDKKAGVIKPKLIYEFNAFRNGSNYVAKGKIQNIEKEDLVFTSKLVQFTPRDGEQQAVFIPSEKVDIRIVAGSTNVIDDYCGTRVPGHPFPIKLTDLLGYAVHFRGETAMSKIPVAVSLYFQVKESYNAILVDDPIVSMALHDMRNQLSNSGRNSFTKSELDKHLTRMEQCDGLQKAMSVRQRVNLDISSNFLSHSLKVVRGAGAPPYEGQPCLPDEAPPEDDLACQLTDEWQWVKTPAHIANAYKGDTILSPGGDGVIAQLLHSLDPEQLYSHCGIMTQNHYEIRHCTSCEDRYADYKIGTLDLGPLGKWDGTDGIEPDIVKYGWPGTITQTVQAAYNGEEMIDPENGKKYSVGSFNKESPVFGTNTLPIDPLVVRPDPFIEAAMPECRKTLRNVAEVAKTLNGHYRFYGYSDASIGIGDAQHLAPNRNGWWAANTLPLVCSSMIWTAMKQCQEPKIQLEGAGQFTERWELEPTDTISTVGAQVDSQTRDGLYFYTENERRRAANVLYSFGYNKAKAEIPSWVPDWVAGHAPENVGNQLVNAFAFDWTGENSNGDNAKDSDDWQNNCNIGRAVAPDNIKVWDAPTQIKDGVQYGVYGNWIKADYREETFEYRRISRWVRVQKTGNLTGTVLFNGQKMSGITVEIANQTAVTDSNGHFSISAIRIGAYSCYAGVDMNGGYYNASLNVTIDFDKTTDVTITLQEPDSFYRECVFDGALQIHEEELGDDGWYNRERNQDQHKSAIFLSPYNTHAEHGFDQWCDDLHVTGRVVFDWIFDEGPPVTGGAVRVAAEATIRQDGHDDAHGSTTIVVRSGEMKDFILNTDDGDSNWMYLYGTVKNLLHGRV